MTRKIIPLMLLMMQLNALSQEVPLDSIPPIHWLHTDSSYVRILPQRPMVIIEATRAGDRTPVTSTTLNALQIKKLNTGQDIPYILRFTPSVTVTSDAGNGIGYTGMWIRGTDPSRINVTINGVPLNDPESQQVFWVDIPDFASSTNEIQIQRGAGTSTNGAGSFGGAIKMNTNFLYAEPFASFTETVGSFRTFRHTLEVGTGMLQNGIALVGRLSSISSDGYIDRASSQLESYFFSATRIGFRNKISFLSFGGKELTYQSWYGTPESRLNGDVEAMNVHALNNGLDAEETANLLNSGRTYNFYTYPNQVDDYRQRHYQLHYQKELGRNSLLNLSVHYTRGFGFFEEYKKDQAFTSYELPVIPINQQQLFSDQLDENGHPINTSFESSFDNENIQITYSSVLDSGGQPIVDSLGNFLLNAEATIARTDLVRRRGLENDFYGGIASWKINLRKMELVIGSGINRYEGKHYGAFSWLQFAGNAFAGDTYYNGSSTKDEAHVYAKASRKINASEMYADVQFRTIDYSTSGTDNDLRRYDVHDQPAFINARLGWSSPVDKFYHWYASVALAGHEPNRNDYIDAPEGQKPLPEQMIDVEAGLHLQQNKWSLRATMYHMQYKDQLVLTGALNDVGAPLRSNVSSSYRQGIEILHVISPARYLSWQLTASLSNNRILRFNETLYDYTDGYDELNIVHEHSHISFSPGVNSSSIVTFSFFRPNSKQQQLQFDIMSRYVGKQYLDNTSNDERALDAYLVNDVQLSWQRMTRWAKECRLSLVVQNLLNADYSSNGYTYSYIYGNRVTENFYYPQAGINFLLTLSVAL